MTNSEASRNRISKWLEKAKPINEMLSWTETRLAIDFGGHTYIVTNGQIYQCVHCGHLDPEWNATEVLEYFKDNFGIKPREIYVTCSVADL